MGLTQDIWEIADGYPDLQRISVRLLGLFRLIQVKQFPRPGQVIGSSDRMHPALGQTLFGWLFAVPVRRLTHVMSLQIFHSPRSALAQTYNNRQHLGVVPIETAYLRPVGTAAKRLAASHAVDRKASRFQSTCSMQKAEANSAPVLPLTPRPEVVRPTRLNIGLLSIVKEFWKRISSHWSSLRFAVPGTILRLSACQPVRFAVPSRSVRFEEKVCRLRGFFASHCQVDKLIQFLNVKAEQHMADKAPGAT